jgi:hypothetical protein
MTDLNAKIPSGEGMAKRIVMKPVFRGDLLGQTFQLENAEAV